MQCLHRGAGAFLPEIIFGHKVHIFGKNDPQRISQIIVFTVPYEQPASAAVFPEIGILVLIKGIHSVMGMDIGV